MSDPNKHSRVDKFQKRRKITKIISVLIIVGAILFIALLWMWLFGGNESSSTESKPDASKDPAVEENNKQEDSQEKNEQADEDSDVEDKEGEDEEKEDDDKEGNDEDEEVEIEKIETSEDNVIEAYTGNWSPVGTEQEGPHTTQFDKSSQDWKEMHEAIEVATDLQEEQMTTHWIGNDGEQKVVATVSDHNTTNVYRVYLSWVDEKGWQPTKVEVLEEVDY